MFVGEVRLKDVRKLGQLGRRTMGYAVQDRIGKERGLVLPPPHLQEQYSLGIQESLAGKVVFVGEQVNECRKA